MVLAQVPHGTGIVRSLSVSAILGLALVAPALAADAPTEPAADGADGSSGITSLAAPWAATELDGAQAIASGHGRYVAVGSAGEPRQAAAWTSTDGIAWDEAVVAGRPDGSAMIDVTATETGFVAFGVESEIDDQLGERVLAWFSPDGLEWQAVSVKGPSKSGHRVGVFGLADGSAGTLALGGFTGQPQGSQRLWQTADGLTWTRARLPSVSRRVWLTDVRSVPQGYLLLGRTVPGKPFNWRSADGMSWTRLRGTPLLYDVAVSDTGILAGVGFEDVFRSSGSLRDWQKVLSRPESWQVDTANAYGWVRWDGSEFVVAGYDHSRCTPSSSDTAADPCHRNPLLVSVEGTTWTEAAGPDGLPGADEGVWIKDVASLGDSTVLLGLDHGTTTVWTVRGGVTE